MIRKLAYPAWMLVFVAIAIARRELVFCAGAGAIGLGARFVAGRAWRASAGIALANLITLLRLTIVACLPLLFAALPRAAFAALVVLLLVLDSVDGRVARARGEASELGAALDMETDALTVMVLSLLLWRDVGVGAWVLVAGLWRYVYASATAVVPALGDSPPSRMYRSLFGCLMIAFAVAFVPIPALARASAAIGTAIVSFSFLHSLARSRAFRSRPFERNRPQRDEEG